MPSYLTPGALLLIQSAPPLIQILAIADDLRFLGIATRSGPIGDLYLLLACSLMGREHAFHLQFLTARRPRCFIKSNTRALYGMLYYTPYEFINDLPGACLYFTRISGFLFDLTGDYDTRAPVLLCAFEWCCRFNMISDIPLLYVANRTRTTSSPGNGVE